MIQEPIRIVSLATVNNTLIYPSKCMLKALQLTNIGAAVAFVKLFDKATAPVAGTDVPMQTISVPANGVPVTIDCGEGTQFNAGLGLAITNLIATADTTAVAAGQVRVTGSFEQA